MTLSGVSSGGLSVLSQLVSPGARGLFARAIAESGTYNLTQVSLGTAEAAGQAFAAKAGCAGNTAACLRALPVATVVDNEDFAGYRPDIDEIFACPALTVDQSLSKYVPTYAYEFNDENAPERYLQPVGFPYGAAHESEVQYLFGLRNTAFPGSLTAQQEHLAATMKAYWTNFAKRGFPSSPAEPSWPRFGGTSQQILSLVAPQPTVETTFAAEHHCAFWARRLAAVRGPAGWSPSRQAGAPLPRPAAR